MFRGTSSANTDHQTVVSLLVGRFTAASRIDNSRSASQVCLEVGLVTNGVEVWVGHGLFGSQTLLCKPSA